MQETEKYPKLDRDHDLLPKQRGRIWGVARDDRLIPWSPTAKEASKVKFHLKVEQQKAEMELSLLRVRCKDEDKENCGELYKSKGQSRILSYQHYHNPSNGKKGTKGKRNTTPVVKLNNCFRLVANY